MLEWWERPYKDHGRGPAAFDCWGLYREAYLRDFGLRLPDYGECYHTADDTHSVGSVLLRELAHWHRVTELQKGALIVLNVARRPFHCAYALDAHQMLHTLPGSGSVIEQIHSPRWVRRIEGIYLWR